MINEAKCGIMQIVAQNGVPQVPMLFLFLMELVELVLIKKHGEGYRKIHLRSGVWEVHRIGLPTLYVHDYEYGRISEEIKVFED